MDRSEAIMSRMVARELYEADVARRVLRLLKELEIDLADDLAGALGRLSAKDATRLLSGNYTTQRLKRLLELVNEYSVEWTRIVRKQIDEGGLDLVEAEIQFERSFIEKYVVAPSAGKIVLNVTGLVTPRQVFAAAKVSPMDGKLLKDLFPEMARSVKRRVTTQLRKSYMAGHSIPQAIKSVRGVQGLEVNRRGAEMLVRTALPHFSYHAIREASEALGAEKFIWISTLDNRTTAICRSLDGRIFRFDDPEAPRVPRHIRCRSAIAPWFDGDELTGGRASATGVVPDSMNYNEWLKRQPADYARSILGPERYDIWKSGVSMSGFTDKYATRVLTIKELRSKYAEILAA